MVAETMPETSDAVPLLGTRLTMICRQFQQLQLNQTKLNQLNKPYKIGKTTLTLVSLKRD